MPTPGIVTSLRVNPTDAMSVIDMLDYLGVPKENMSFAQAAKIVLASSLEAYRQQGFIPRRTGFEYSEMIAPFTRQDPGAHAAKLQLTKTKPELRVEPSVPEAFDRRIRRLRFEELMVKRNAAPESMDADEKEELSLLLTEFQ